jgi:HJR/Mrr/RecB family endonuclease
LELLQRHAAAIVNSAKADFSRAEHEHNTAVSEFQSRLRQLRDCNWAQMSGVDFERFLQAVLEELGFDVQLTKTTGDQGVDLIAVKQGFRLAIQAKGYPNCTVGNDAVQQAHTGRDLYDCHQAVVITNSTFTKSANEAAQGVGCLLIDGSQILNLIEGRIELVPPYRSLHIDEGKSRATAARK